MQTAIGRIGIAGAIVAPAAYGFRAGYLQDEDAHMGPVSIGLGAIGGAAAGFTLGGATGAARIGTTLLGAAVGGIVGGMAGFTAGFAGYAVSLLRDEPA